MSLFRTYHNLALSKFTKVLWAFCFAALSTTAVQAKNAHSIANAAMTLFADNCFSPFMTANKAETLFTVAGVSYDFYDLDPFSSAPPSPAQGRDVTQGTDRRCEIRFDGSYGPEAMQTAIAALKAEGIRTPGDVPAYFTRTKTTYLLAARRLNLRRVAVVHVGTREGPAGIETFMLVERLLPEAQPENGKG